MPEPFDVDAFKAKLQALIAELPEKEALASLRPSRLAALKEEIEAEHFVKYPPTRPAK
jgi:hypothetical protein